MEYFDVYDKNRNLINKKLPRGAELKHGEFNQGVAVWIINNEGKILLSQRSAIKSHPLKWEAPGGCSVVGESSVETAIREIREEIGLNLKSADLNLLTTKLYKKQFVDVYMVKYDLKIEDLVLQKEEVAQVKWVSFDEIEKIIENGEMVSYSIEHYNFVKSKLM